MTIHECYTVLELEPRETALQGNARPEVGHAGVPLAFVDGLPNSTRLTCSISQVSLPLRGNLGIALCLRLGLELLASRDVGVERPCLGWPDVGTVP